jgi:alditol oxidase
VTSRLGNWAGTYHFTAREVISARTVDDVRRAVTAGGHVRAIGARHSFTDLADTSGTLISLAGIAPDPVLDEQARTVTVGAGTSYGMLAAWLQERGWALGAMASLPHISIAGATATATHGSGTGNQVLSAAIAGLEYVDASGDLRHAGREAPELAGLAVGLGAFGIITRVTLDVEPSYLVRQDMYAGLPWDRALADLDAIMSAAYSVSLFTTWLGDSVPLAWVKRRLDEVPEPTGAVPADPVPTEFYGARLATGPVHVADAPEGSLTPAGVPGPWSEHVPHFRADCEPGTGNEVQTEYFVPLDQGAAALAAVRSLGRRMARVLLVSEIRAVAADDLWLSGAYCRPALAIRFTWRRNVKKIIALLPTLQAELEPFGARPHWGTVWRRFSLDPLYPRLADARNLFERLDPDGAFSTDRLELLGIRESRSLRCSSELHRV